jgi:hypothetical protein
VCAALVLAGAGSVSAGCATWPGRTRLGVHIPLHQLVEAAQGPVATDPECAGGRARVFEDGTVAWAAAGHPAVGVRPGLIPASRCTREPLHASVPLGGGRLVAWDRGEFGGGLYFEHDDGACQPLLLPWGWWTSMSGEGKYVGLQAEEVIRGRGDAWLSTRPSPAAAPGLLWHVRGSPSGLVARPVARSDGGPVPEGELRGVVARDHRQPAAFAGSPERAAALWLNFGTVVRELREDGTLRDRVAVRHPWAARLDPLWGALLGGGSVLFSYGGAVLRLDPDGDTWRETWLLPPWCAP